VGIQNSAGTEVVRYTYDSWGKPISTTGTMAATLGFINPFRYRGYVYDEETGLYYLRSRYYNPEWNRFVNADSVMRGNLFSYCNSEPVKYADTNGKSTHLICMSIWNRDVGDYRSPSFLTPQAVLQKGMRGKNTGKIPVGYLLAYLDQMVKSGDWKYRDAKMEWKSVDCIGMIRLAFQQYSQKLARNSQTYVGGMCDEAIKQGIEILPVSGDEHAIEAGMAIYWYNPAHKNKRGQLRPWYHIGVYVGTYFDETTSIYYTDAVIEAASSPYNAVVVRSLADISSGLNESTSLYHGYLQDVDY
ncbi:MAG: RHS repeat-associated core domain-containing protein, partial [Bacteroidales bacterium]|nr:RHS repeat-associated core domain-containing protein [Bacteroidales bacterium]